jgi:hypothetical protein
MSGSYLMLRDTWVYQDLKQEAQKEMQQIYVEQQQNMLLAIVQARFPRIEGLVRQLIKDRNELELLQTLIIQVGTARLEKDARQSIAQLVAKYSRG